MNPLARLLTVGQLDCFRTSALRDLQQREHLAKNLSRVSAVDFFNDQYKWPIWLALGGLDSLHQYAIDEFEAPVAGRAPSAHKILVGKRRVKLHDAESRTSRLTVVGAGKRKSEAFRQPGLPRAGRTLENKVHLGPPAVEDFCKL